MGKHPEIHIIFFHDVGRRKVQIQQILPRERNTKNKNKKPSVKKLILLTDPINVNDAISKGDLQRNLGIYL